MGIADDFGLNAYSQDDFSAECTQDYVPVKNIYGGIILTKDGRYLRILEVLPVNMESMSLAERDDVTKDFQSWLSIAPVDMQIKIMTDKSRPEKLIGKAMHRYKSETDEKTRGLIGKYIELLSSLGGSGAVSRRFFLIISYEMIPGKRAGSISEIASEMDKAAGTISGFFERMGNIVAPLSETGKPDDEQWAVMDFLYRLYNPRSSENEPGRMAISLEQRVERIFRDTQKITGNSKALCGIDDVIAPMGVDLGLSDAVVMDGLYHSYLLVSGDGYPASANAGWYGSYFSMAPGESVDMFIHKEPRSDFLRNVSRKIKYTGVKLDEKNRTQADYEQTENALYSAAYIKDAINNGGEEPFYLTTLLTITAYDYESLKRRREEITDTLRASGIGVLALKHIQEDALRSSLPFLDLSRRIYSKGRRNIMSSGLASCYPFVSPDMYDEGGILMGLDSVNSTMCIMNPFNQKAYKNANMVILGTSGAGKTYTEQLMALRMRMMGTQCFILAPDKAHEFKRACTDGVGGEFIKIAASSKDHINIMDIRPSVSKSDLFLKGDAADNTILVSEKAGTLVTFMSLLIPDLTNEEEQIIDSCVMSTYRKYGITEDNRSLYVDPDDHRKGLKKMPVIGDLYRELEESQISRRILNILSQFVTGSARSFNERTNVDLRNRYIVFDLSGLQGRLLPAGMFVALDFIVGRIREDVTERKMIFIDEGWQLIGSGANEKAAEYVKWLFKIIRGYNGGACIATQDIQDFFSLKGGEYGNAILSNSQIKMLLNLSPGEAAFVEKELRLNREELRMIRNFARGQCLVCANSNHIPVNIIGSEYETELITTDPELVEKVMEKRKRNGETYAV